MAKVNTNQDKVHRKQVKSTQKKVTRQMLLYTFNQGIEQGKKEMLEAACSYLESIEIDVYFNANGARPDFDYERFTNDFRVELTDPIPPTLRRK